MSLSSSMHSHNSLITCPSNVLAFQQLCVSYQTKPLPIDRERGHPVCDLMGKDQTLSREAFSVDVAWPILIVLHFAYMMVLSEDCL